MALLRGFPRVCRVSRRYHYFFLFVISDTGFGSGCNSGSPCFRSINCVSTTMQAFHTYRIGRPSPPNISYRGRACRKCIWRIALVNYSDTKCQVARGKIFWQAAIVAGAAVTTASLPMDSFLGVLILLSSLLLVRGRIGFTMTRGTSDGTYIRFDQSPTNMQAEITKELGAFRWVFRPLSAMLSLAVKTIAGMYAQVLEWYERFPV